MSTSTPLIEARGLSKRYGTFVALDDVSFQVNRGEVVAFLGPNGAGKSTTMKILTGYLAPTSGSAHIGGLNVATDRLEASRRLGYLPENGPLYPEMTPRELLEFFATARSLGGSQRRERMAHVAKVCNLESVFDKPIAKLSKGFRQRVGMAHAMLHNPDALIMDEPTSGLDPNQIRGVRDAIKALGEDKAVLLSTHILQEVEALADRVILINRGRLEFQGTPEELRARGEGNLDSAFHAITGAAR